jgi:SAM-dependent methyltransferase
MNTFSTASNAEARFRELLQVFPSVSEADRGYIKRASRRMWLTLQHLPPATGTEALLDVGSMRGLFAPAYVEIWRYGQVTLLGMDTSVGSLERMIGNRKYVFPTARCNIEIERWPFDDAIFDAVVCTEVLEHLIFDPAFAMNEMNRVLKPGGIALITVPNAASDNSLLKLINDMQPGFLRHYISDALESGRRDLETVYHVGHFHEYTGTELRALAEAVGFTTEKLQGLDIHPLPFRSFRFKLILKLVHWLFPRAHRIRESNILALFRKRAYVPLEQLSHRYPAPLYQPLVASSEKSSA